MFSDLFENTKPIWFSDAKKAVKELYEYCKKPEPEYVYVKGPQDLADAMDLGDDCFDAHRADDIAHFGGRRSQTKDMRMQNVINATFRDKCESLKVSPYLMPDYATYNSEGGHRYEYPFSKLVTAVWNSCFFCVTFEKTCYIVERPLSVMTDDTGYHNKNGPAVVFHDGTEVYCYEGFEVDKRFIVNPKSMTLKDIHKGNSRTHRMINLVGLERYLELVKDFKIDTTGKFKKFFGFAKIHEYANSYTDRTYSVEIINTKVNGKYCLLFKDSWREYYAFLNKDDKKLLLDKQDYELWDTLNLKELFSRCFGVKLILSYNKGVFALKSESVYNTEGNCRGPNNDAPKPLVCHRDVAPAWVKSQISQGKDVEYKDKNATVVFKDGELQVETEHKLDRSLFRGNNNLPQYKFDIDLKSNTWDDLLNQWANLSFEWLSMSEDSRKFC
jgi:hypothetical protein